MEQATQPTTTTAPAATATQIAGRASYHRARALADWLVDQVPTLPTAAEAHRSFALDSYEARLHFGAGFIAGRGVLETAALTDTEPTREEKRDDQGSLVGYWIGLRTVVDGVPLSAWALTNPADADELLQETADATAETAGEATQPMPTVGTGPADIVAPAVTVVRPLTAVKTTPGSLTGTPESGK
ncbi:hypothetical protein [Streptomyces sp. NPDC048392]|uniref:hypothetical protein n=1 Tax=Streptomyces sp. NPDC048392 TaxID=3365543 RepID=UPI00371C5E7C